MKTILMLSLVLFCGSRAGLPAPNETDEQRWIRLLDCSLAWTASCEEFATAIAAEDADHGPLGGLARAAIQEAQWAERDPRFLSPRLVWSAPIDTEQLQRSLPRGIRAATVTLRVSVDVGGAVTDCRMLTPSEYAILNRAALSAAQTARFRPAKDRNGRFISKQADLPFTIEVR